MLSRYCMSTSYFISMLQSFIRNQEGCVACVSVKSLPGMCEVVFAEVYTAVGC